ncbi:Bax inhibitor-1/YccA family protein [Nesterenkonia aerolata]|uniref:Bax inhibitor-1/YccA family protein n=1 Tax=Nesterenkonia aerolata TaxID=3074079 RepID=A0ABU2DR15_9MICC|nr:Bax inhibitor-1/YccA family protein [Nesterenkonia sp. LY-0111]MDR8018836.1 Bax inhibitor-1/YccA family protein [Nesterenkonia sp. LY-0111]
MSNPIFNTQAFPDQFNENKRQRSFTLNGQGHVTENTQYPAQGQTYAQQHGMPGQQTGQYGQQAGAEQLHQMYGQPSPSGQDMGRMTFDDVIRKTLISFVVVMLGAGVSVTAGVTAPAVLYPLMLVGVFGGLILGLVNAFKREPNVALILAYSLTQGLFIGAFSFILEMQFPGIVVQAVVATLIVFGTILALFKSGKVRATPKLTKMFMVAATAYLIFCLVNLGFMLLGGTSSMFGLRTEFSPWIGLAIGALAILLATYSLVMDFTNIDEGVKAGVAQRYGWSAAFGLTVSIVWLYIEILRIIAIIRSMGD